MAGDKKPLFFLEVVRKKTGLSILIKKSLKPMRTEKEN